MKVASDTTFLFNFRFSLIQYLYFEKKLNDHYFFMIVFLFYFQLVAIPYVFSIMPYKDHIAFNIQQHSPLTH